MWKVVVVVSSMANDGVSVTTIDGFANAEFAFHAVNVLENKYNTSVYHCVCTVIRVS